MANVAQIYMASVNNLSEQEIAKKYGIDRDTVDFQQYRSGVKPLPKNRALALKLYEEGVSLSEIKDKTNLSTSTIQSIVKSYGTDSLGLYPHERFHLSFVLTTTNLRGEMFYTAINPKLKGVPEDYIENLLKNYQDKILSARAEYQ